MAVPSPRPVRRRLRGSAAALLAAVALLAATAALPASADGGPGWHRVRFDGPVTAADRALLADVGVTEVHPAAGDAYVVHADAAQAAALADAAGVASVAALTAADKVDADLLAAGDGPVQVQVLRHGGAAPAQADEVHATFRVTSVPSALRGSVVTLQRDEVARVAADPAVLHVGLTSTRGAAEDEGTAQILAGRGPVAGYRDTLAALGVDGSGVTVAVVDTGVDEEHPDLAGRVTGVVSYSRQPVDEVTDSGGHGTHVAGIIAGTGADLPAYGPVRDGQGLRYGQGVAPGASLLNLNYLGTLAGLPPGGFPQITRDALRLGAVAWNASWTDGGGVGVGYNANAALMDALVRDGDQATAGAQPISLVFSAGNSGPGTAGTSRITSPKEAKNIIAVAASNGQRAGSPDRIASFSSRGPALDGRVVPTVTAPGASVSSSRPWAGQSCGTPVLAASPPIHALCSGTSMASPHVAGAVALVTEWWREANGGATPSPALVKALLVNTAVDLDFPDIPNRDEGWGRVDVGAALAPEARRVYVDQSVLLDELGEASVLSVRPADPSRPVRATLVWTDAPGLPESRTALVNDLDLRVTTPAGATFLGNAFVDGRSVATGAPGGGQADRINNVENVFLPAAGDGTYTVSVTAAALPGDGVPGNGARLDQDFALVLDNAVLVQG
jgi:subtilisin family serine protease